MGSAEPVLLPTLATEAFEAIPTGAEYTRVEKTARIREFPLSYRYLDVCTAFQAAGDKRNCGRCPKCLRTCITLDLLGSLDLYAGMFNLVPYHEIRRYYMGIILGSDNKFHREIAQLIVEKDFPVPLRSRLTSWKHRLLGNRGS